MKSLRDNSEFQAAAPNPQASAATVRRMPAAGPQGMFFHLDFVRSLQMHRKLAMGIFFTFLALSAGYMAKRWNTYKAQALVYVQPSPHKVIESGQAQQWPYDANTYESYIQQQVHDVTRPDVLAAALKQLPGWQGSRESEQAAADRLGSAVEVTRVGSAYEVQIESTAGSREEAAQIANAVAASYIDSATREQRAGDPQRIELLKEERDRILKELGSDRTEQESLNRQLGVAAVSGATPDPIDDQIAQTRAELVKARTANDEAAAKLTALSGKGATNAALDAEADEIVAADPGLVSMKTALNKRRSDLISQMANLTPNHPQYKQDAEELAKINASLESMSHELRAKASAQISQKLKNDLERTSSVEARLNGRLGQLTGAAGTAAPRMQRLNELETDIQRLQNRFTAVDEQYRNLTMENSSPGAVYLASTALPPLHAARAKVLRNGFIVILAGLMLALASALIAHNFDKRIYIAQDVERVLGFAPMAQIPDMSEVGAGVAEEYMLRLAAAVEHAHQQGMLNSCIVTGITTGAGVTTVSTHVSGMLQAMGRETVLVDTVGAPQARLGEPGGNHGTGLVHAPRGSRSTALLQQMNEEAGEDSVVVTDTAPLLVSGETEYLARFVDSAIVVIESGVTTKAQLREVAQTLQRLEVSSVGFVLNRISLKNANAGFRESVAAVESHLRAQARQAEAVSTRPAPVKETWAQSVQEVQPLRIAPEQPQPAAPAHENVADMETQQVVESPVPVPTAAPVAEPKMVVRTPEPVAEPVVPAAARTEVAPAERWGLPSYTPAYIAPRMEMAAEETVVELAAAAAEVPATVSEPSAAPEPEEPVNRIEELDKPEEKLAQRERPAANSPFRAQVALPMRGRQTVRFAPAVESKQEAMTPDLLFPERKPVLNEPMPELEYEPVQAAVAVEEAVIDPAVESTNLWDYSAATAAHDAYWGGNHQPPIAEQPATVAPERITSSATMVLAPVPEPVAVAAGAFEAESERTGSIAVSRLSGLRSLMTSLGVKNLRKELEAHRAHLELPADVERPAERPIFAQPEAPASTAAASRALLPEVVARPEIIPPRVTPNEPAERESDVRRPVKAPRVSRWDTVDDVEILPSKRGQYRKRH
ncbi:GumC family protein [Occallatibacter riparius]|uniref:Polysaccharide chain length determinant N-terminal domain-containing protein n=1 Tax=Occallatibacter riparius TaxID=1002689 RepID=A0A9J7BV81_9BACT|nr:hypothetical protein [Occallatibacter riparius]UWZ86583.1 hypothetical protein MOP44_11705 [Occallatibacter riparius]